MKKTEREDEGQLPQNTERGVAYYEILITCLQQESYYEYQLIAEEKRWS